MTEIHISFFYKEDPKSIKKFHYLSYNPFDVNYQNAESFFLNLDRKIEGEEGSEVEKTFSDVKVKITKRKLSYNIDTLGDSKILIDYWVEIV